MTAQARAILITLVVYKIALVAIGLWASRRTHDATDFFLGGRRLGALVAAISASASSSSAWTLLGVSGAAYVWGLPALWLFPATVSGFLINWLFLAPRLMPLAQSRGAVTLTDVLASDAQRSTRAIVLVATVIVLFSFMFYIAAQFQAAGDAFAETFELTRATSILIGGGVILLYTLLGGFWAVSVTDTLQGLLMALTAIALPAAALIAVGGVDGLVQGLAAVRAAAPPAGPATYTGLAAAAFVLGTLGIGLGYPGQPHVVNRFMALRDTRALAQAQRIAIAWAVIVYAGMLLLGLCGRVLIAGHHSAEQVFYALASALFPPVVAGVMLAAVLSAIMSTADSQLLVAASSVAHDLRRDRGASSGRLGVSRLVVVVLSVVAVVIALFAPQTIFARVLFAWHAVGSAFGPVVIALALGMRVAPGARLASMLVGFSLTVLLHWLPDAPGDVLERVLPLALAGAIVVAGSRRPALPVG